MALGLTTEQKNLLNKMCPAAVETQIGSIIDSLATEASVTAGARSLTATNSLVQVTCVGSVVHDGNIKAFAVFVAPPGGATVKNGYVLAENAITANGTDKWTINLHNATDTVSLLAAAATTATTAIAAYAKWSLGTIGANGVLHAGDVIVAGFTGAASVESLGGTSVVLNYTR